MKSLTPLPTLLAQLSRGTVRGYASHRLNRHFNRKDSLNLSIDSLPPALRKAFIEEYGTNTIPSGLFDWAIKFRNILLINAVPPKKMIEGILLQWKELGHLAAREESLEEFQNITPEMFQRPSELDPQNKELYNNFLTIVNGKVTLATEHDILNAPYLAFLGIDSDVYPHDLPKNLNLLAQLHLGKNLFELEKEGKKMITFCGNDSYDHRNMDAFDGLQNETFRKMKLNTAFKRIITPRVKPLQVLTHSYGNLFGEIFAREFPKKVSQLSMSGRWPMIMDPQFSLSINLGLERSAYCYVGDIITRRTPAQQTAIEALAVFHDPMKWKINNTTIYTLPFGQATFTRSAYGHSLKAYQQAFGAAKKEIDDLPITPYSTLSIEPPSHLIAGPDSPQTQYSTNLAAQIVIAAKEYQKVSAQKISTQKESIGKPLFVPGPPMNNQTAPSFEMLEPIDILKPHSHTTPRIRHHSKYFSSLEKTPSAASNLSSQPEPNTDLEDVRKSKQAIKTTEKTRR